MEQFLGISVLVAAMGFSRHGEKQISLLGPERSRRSKVTGLYRHWISLEFCHFKYLGITLTGINYKKYRAQWT